MQLRNEQPIEEFPLSRRTINCLLANGINTVGDAAALTRSQVLALKGAGVVMLDELETLLGVRDASDGRAASISHFGTVSEVGSNSLKTKSEVNGEMAEKPSVVLSLISEEKVQQLTALSVDEDLDEQIIELVRQVQELMQTPIEVALYEWALPSAVLDAYLNSLCDMSISAASDEIVDVIAEVTALLLPQKPRTQRMLIKRHGFGDGHGVTLEEIGNDEGITRERARQIITKCEKELRTYRPPLPFVHCVLTILHNRAIPISLERWQQLIPFNIRPEKEKLLVIATLAEWGWIPTTWTLRYGGTTFVCGGRIAPDDFTNLIRQIQPCIRKLKQAQVVPRDVIESLSGLPERDAVELISNVVPLRRIGTDWIAIARLSESWFCQRLVQMISILGPLSVPQIYKGMRRETTSFWGRANLQCPPIPIIDELISVLRFPRDGDLITGAPASAVLKPLSRTERIVIAQLLESGRPLTTEEVESHAVNLGAQSSVTHFVLGQSALVERCEGGLYIARGREVTVEGLKAARRQRAQSASQTTAGEVIARRTTHILLRFPLTNRRPVRQMYIPKQAIPRGIWTYVDGRHRQEVRARTFYVTGLLEIVRKCQDAGWPSVTFRFDRSARTVTLLPE